MPAIFRYTIFMNGSNHGASESWYFTQDSDDVNTAVIKIQTALLQPKRAALLNKDWHVEAFRVARVQNAAGLKNVRRAKLVEQFLPGNQSQVSSEANVSLLVECQTADLEHTKRFYLVAPYRSVIPFDDSYDPAGGGAWTTNWNAYVAALINAGMGWISQVPSDPFPVTAYTFSAITGLTTFTVGGNPFAGNQDGDIVRVRMNFPPGHESLDGTYLVQVGPGAGTCTSVKPRPTKPFTLAGKMVTFTPTVVTLNTPFNQQNTGTIEIERAVTRQRGRPTLASRGRAPVVVRW